MVSTRQAPSAPPARRRSELLPCDVKLRAGRLWDSSHVNFHRLGFRKKKSTRLRSVASSWKTPSVSAESTLSRARPLAPGSSRAENARTRDFGSCAQRQDACHGCGAVPSPRHEGVSTLSQTNIIRHRKLTNSEGKNQRFPLLLCFVPGPLLESVGALDSFFLVVGRGVLRLFPAVRVSSCLFVTCSFELSSQRKVSRLGPWDPTPTGVKIIFLLHQKARSSGSCGQLASWVSAAPGKNWDRRPS